MPSDSKIDTEFPGFDPQKLEDCIARAKAVLPDKPSDLLNLTSMDLQHASVLNWFDQLSSNIQYGIINTAEANKEIRAFLAAREERYKKEPLDYLRDKNQERKDFFFEVATLIATRDNEPIINILKPGITQVVPNNGYSDSANERLIEVTEVTSINLQSAVRRLKPTLVYVQSEDGTERLLDIAAIYKEALEKDDSLFLQPAVIVENEISPYLSAVVWLFLLFQ
ncbi:MAG: hypothetical protein K2Q14_06520 [Gammaproteobacteria bacterium]|nr:hypothetical protein [Gammaproteobacteria bacterium]